MSVTFEPSQVLALLESALGAAPPPDDDPVAVALALREADRARAFREGDDDHFYGPWKGGSMASGGRPMTKAEAAAPNKGERGYARQRLRMDDPRRGGPEDPRQTFMSHAEWHWRDRPNGGREAVITGWHADRVAEVHEPYYAKTLAGIPTSDSPTVHMTGGGPASGKTVGLLENPGAGFKGPKEAAHINPDTAKEATPEYRAAVKRKDPTGGNTAHEESSHMAKVATRRALEGGHDVVLDVVGDSGIEKLSAKVAEMRSQGAKRVVADYAFVPDVRVAVARAKAREKRKGRGVPERVILSGHRDVSRTWQAAAARGIFDRLRLWDTSGETPVLVATAEGGRLVVLDAARFAKFKAIGEEG